MLPILHVLAIAAPALVPVGSGAEPGTDAAAGPAPLAPAAAHQDETDPEFEKAKRRYEEYLRRLPLLMHTRGRTYFAETRDPRALEILAASYERPMHPREQVRHLLAGICFRNFRGPQFIERWIQWRLDNDDPSDAYLWYRALMMEIRELGPDSSFGVLDDPDAEWEHRVVALRALTALRVPSVVDRIPGLCAELPKKDEHRTMLVGAMGGALLANNRALGGEEFDKAANAYAQLLDEENDLTDVAQLTVARYLGQTLGVGRLYLESEPWLRQIKAKSAAGGVREPDTSHTVTGPSFFGLEATGKRIVYVIDMSDSMCKPIDHAIKPRGPVTGGSRKKRDKDDMPTVDDIPWDRVNNRFDLAREHLKISLQRLSDDKEFAVVFFGSEARLLDSCRGMTEVSDNAIRKVIKELDAIVPGPATTDSPDGQLRGATNLHGGVRRAFQVKERGIAEEDEYIDADALLEGADTIFVLSDGEPTWDDWDEHDKNYGEDNVVHDVESGIAAPETDNLHYHGPYRMPVHLLDDLERIRLFRDVEIHCVGIGEADMRLLQQITDIGLGGKTHRVGT